MNTNFRIELNAKNFFQVFIHNPRSHFLTRRDSITATVSAAVLTIMSCGALPLISRCIWGSRKVEILSHSLRTIILKYTDSAENRSSLQRTRASFSKILGGLCMGNSQAFLSVSALKETELDRASAPLGIKTNNPHRFKQVITLCPFYRALQYYLKSGLRLSYEELIAKIRVRKWLNIGHTMQENALQGATLIERWRILAHDCTLVESASKPNLEMRTHIREIAALKSADIAKMPVDKWFEPVFQVIDKAVFENTQTLIHCETGEVTSPTVMIAYLINRFRLNHDQALSFLILRYDGRIDSIYSRELQSYANALNQLRPLDVTDEARRPLLADYEYA